MAVLSPVITGVYDDFGTYQGKIGSIFDATKSGDPLLTDDDTPRIHGTATPGAVLNIYSNATLIGTAVAGDDWAWDCNVTQPLASGSYFLQAYQGTYPGPDSSFSSLYGFNITHVLTPVITDVVDDTGTSKIHVANGSQTSDLSPTIVGTAEPGNIIEIFDNGVKIGQTSTPSDASTWYKSEGWAWSFTPTTPLDHSTTHVFSAVAQSAIYAPYVTDLTHSTSDYTIGIGVTPAQPALLAPVITSVVDDVGVNQGAVADGGQTNDVRPTLHGTSEPGTVVTVSDNGHVIGTATTGADWQWTFTPGADLAAGANTLSVSAARADGTGSVAAWYTHGLDVTPSLDAVLATAGLSAAPAATPAVAAPTVQAAYVSEAAHPAAVLPQHDLAY